MFFSCIHTETKCGIFKNFKKVLREYPEVEKQWFSFKKQKMSQIVVEWYNTLRSSWGLEALDEEPGDNADIIHDDFNFREVSFSRDLEKIRDSEEACFFELKENQDGEIGSVISEISRRLHKSFEKDFSFSLFAETIDGVYAGCIEASLIKELERLGIGRPSTYAKIIDILKVRDYISIIANNII